MKFTDIFVQRPVLSIVVSLLILLAGLQAISSLTIRQFPRSDNAAVTVQTTYIGASAVQAAGFDGTGIRVAVLDSGLDSDHPDFDAGFLGELLQVKNARHPIHLVRRKFKCFRL